MSTQQDIYAAGSKNRIPMLNKENYVPWSSRLLRYAKIRPNGKLIHNSIINGPYVRRMILEPGDPNRVVPVNETFHVQTDDKLKQIEVDDQAIQTILLDLPEDIYLAVDSCETAQEIWLRVQQMKKGSDIGIQEKKAKLFNEWERFTFTNGESIESYYHHYTQLYDFMKYNQKEVDDLKAERLAKTQDPIALMATSNNPYTFLVLHQDHPLFNQNYMQQPMSNSEEITDPTTAMNMVLSLMAKAFKLNYSTTTNNNQRISSNPRNRKIAQPARAEGNATGHNGNQIRCYNCRGLDHFARNCTVRPRRRDDVYLQTQLLIAQKEEVGIQLQAEEFDLMAVVADLDEIEEVNANYILMANLQQASTLEHLCPLCEHGKSKRASYPPNPVPNARQRLHLLHMDLCGPMRIASINGKRVYNRKTKKIIKTMNVTFDELSIMAFEQHSSKPGLQSMTSGQISLGLDLTYAPSTITTQQPTEGELDLLFEAMYDDYIGGQPSTAPRTILAAQAHQIS
nr:hypothetical protein [Tanacetum cinerariifolium]